uniref:Uncharacterized protein n=1 Tax=Amphimedon queenslandica TaxID=400682 RepID=A0A1X7UQ69_AMPQE
TFPSLEPSFSVRGPRTRSTFDMLILT